MKSIIIVMSVLAPLLWPVAPVVAQDATVEESLLELRQNLDAYNDESAAFDETANQQLENSAVSADEYYRGEIVSKSKEEVRDIGGVSATFREYEVRILDGAEKGNVVTIRDNDLDAARGGFTLLPGEKIAVVKAADADGEFTYHLADRYRLPALVWMALVFFAAAVLVAGKRGFSAILGLVFTVAVVAGWALPRIMNGGEAFPTLVIAAALIATISIFLAHGFHVRTALAVAATLATLALTVLLELVFAAKASLLGMGSEEAFFLMGMGLGDFDLKGLLLGGILLGALGVLDDVTTAQVAVVAELKAADPTFGFTQLYRRGLAVGREHIASLVNTLFLAYAGASLPLFMLFSAGQGAPAWFIANSEMIAEEIVRALIGSLCLILAVPITTAIAAHWYAAHESESHGGHAH